MNRQNTIIAAALLAALAITCPRVSKGQETHGGESFELDGTLVSTRSYEYKANNYIWLKKGFYSNPQSPNYAMLEIDPYFNPEPPYGNEVWWSPDHPSGYAGKVGTIPTNFEVSETGAAIISLPLEFPEGINGMSPQLSLNYNSQGGDGILGIGWSIGGMSKISRVPYTYMYSDSCGAVLFSDKDDLSLDGNRLRKTPNGRYYPEIFDFSVVDKINGGYKVLRKDGKVCEYKSKYYLQGGSGGLEQPIEWHLNKVEDPFGNSIHYHYTNDRINGSFCPDYIEYTCHDGQIPPYSIVFSYDDRDDTPRKYFSSKEGSHSYRSGFSRISKVLTSIACYYRGNKIVEYKLHYSQTGYWNQKTLYSVRKYCYNLDGTGEMLSMNVFNWNPTICEFKYERASDTLLLGTNDNSNTQWNQFAMFAASFEESHPLLVNTSKYVTDIVHVQYVVNNANQARRFNFNIFRNQEWYSVETGQWYYDYNCQYDCSAVNDYFLTRGEVFAVMPADTDGDGLDEIVCVYGTNDINGVHTSLHICLIRKNDNSSSFYVQPLSIATGQPQLFDNFAVLDFNGDGRSDLYCTYGNDMRVYPSLEGSPFDNSSVIDCGSHSPLTDRRKIVIGDFYGNKKDQILVMNKKDENTTKTKIYYGSNSGDGNHEFLLPDSANICLGDYFFKIDTTKRWNHFLWGDFNGDGKKDALVMQKDKWLFFFSKGNGLFTEAIKYTVESIVKDDFVMTTSEDFHPVFHVADFDQDGCDDISVTKYRYVKVHSYQYQNDDWTFAGICRRDFLIHPKDSLIDVRRIAKIENGTDVMIDSVKWSHFSGNNTINFTPEISLYLTNAYLSCVSMHKGTSPTEILYSRLSGGRHSYDQYNIGVIFHVTGSLDAPPANHIRKITDGLGATTEITYRPYSFQKPFSSAMGAREQDIRSLRKVTLYHGHLDVVQTVKQETRDAENGNGKKFRETRYRYWDAYYHTQGRGFLGFGRTWWRLQGEDNGKDLQTHNTYVVDPNHHVLIPKNSYSRRFNPTNGSPITYDSTWFVYSILDTFPNDLGVIPSEVFVPYLSSRTSNHNNEGRVLFEKETFQKDVYGNMTLSEHRYGTTDTQPYYEKKIMEYEHNINTNRWLTGMLKKDSVVRRLYNHVEVYIPPVSNSISYENDINTGKCFQKTTEPGNSKQLTEAYGYDTYGNHVSTRRMGSGVVRTDSVTYSDDGRFPVAETNAMGHITRYYHDEVTGRLDSVTDPNGLTTRYRYDILGNLVQTEYPSGVLEDQNTLWAVDPQTQGYHPDTPGFGCPIYFSYTKRSGESETYTFYDQHNRKLREVSQTMDGMKTYVDYRYHEVTGLLDSVSAPYHPNLGETPQFTTYSYDYFGRPTRIDRPDGSYMTHTYYNAKEKIRGFDGKNEVLFYSASGLLARSGWSENFHDHDINFVYYGDGKLKWSETDTTNGTQTRIEYTYDVNRNPRTVTDPSLGSLTYDYNAFGELVHSITPRNETSYTYDALGRMKTRFDTDGNSYWTYDNGFVGTLSSTNYVPVNGPTVKESYRYDNLGQLIRQTQNVGDGEEFVFNYTYNRFGKQSSVTYPSGKKFKYHYNSKGFMDQVKDDESGSVIWQADASDRWGNIVDFIEGEIGVTYDYDPVTGLVNGIAATRNGQTILRQSCHWTAKGNLDWRTDATLNLKESFGYDALNRLTSAIGTDLEGNVNHFSQNFDFDQKGNITAKTGLESYAYNSPTNPYAVTVVQPAVGQEGLFTDQTVTYTSFDKIDTVNQEGKTLTVSYGIDRQRVQQTFSDGDNVRTKRYFTPLYESITENGVTKNLHYLTSATGLFAIFVTQNNQGGAMHYTLKDHQGSLTATICGNTVERLSYDAWGRRRDPNGFGYDNVAHTFDRGYTLHEHYDEFDLINMNGRLYDPVLGRMLSPDIAIQDEHNAQAYNRYSYCFNNPLRFTDPSGYVVREVYDYTDWDFMTYVDFDIIRSNGNAFNTDLSEGRISPIYDKNGIFLGTDDEGLQGEAIIMESRDFKQNMSHSEALIKGRTLDNMSDEEALSFANNGCFEKFVTHFNNLPNRPDWDGYLTLSEANKWYRNGNGQRLFVDESLIELDPVYVGSVRQNETKRINFASLAYPNLATGLVYGTITLTGLDDAGMVRIGNERGLIDRYDFEMHRGRPLRNIKTKIGAWVAGDGVPYDIYGYGVGQLRHSVIIPMKY